MFIYGYWLSKNEDGSVISVYSNKKGSPWFRKLSKREAWLHKEEADRLELTNIDHPNTKWSFIGFDSVDVKIILDAQPLLGTGPLPE